MNALLSNICNSLDSMEQSILSLTPDDRTMAEWWGWNFPPLNRHDLSNMVKDLSDAIKVANIEDIDAQYNDRLAQVPVRISVFTSRTLAYLFNGNGQTAMPQFTALLEYVRSTISPILGWEIMANNKALPLQLTKRMRAIHTVMDKVSHETEGLEGKIKTINDAHDAAESFPTDMQSLEDAKQQVTKLSGEATIAVNKLQEILGNSQSSFTIIQERQTEAASLVAKCEEAYMITTTKGLAAAFEERAKRLSNTMWIWVGVLGLALVAGSLIGASRYQSLITTLSSKPSTGVIWFEFVLSLLGLAAPLWLAWLSTKQISQRFKLTEDYSFKASVAKAYEGYRKEAIKFDGEFERRLFSSALDRLDEAPLRLVETDTHSSPWHEMLESKGFQKALDKMPDLKLKLSDLLKKDPATPSLTSGVDAPSEN